MADSRDPNPPLTHRLVGGLQWAVTASYGFLLGVAVWTWYLRRARTAASVDLTPAFAAVLAVSFVAGFLWVGTRPADREAHARRIEVVVTLLVLGFLLPFAVPRLVDLLGIAPQGFPLFGFAAAYALALSLAYGLVYGLGTRFFLGPDPEMLRE